MFEEADVLDGIMNKVATMAGETGMDRSYLAAALWTSHDDNEEPLDKNYDITDVSEESAMKAEKDCADFMQRAGSLLEGIDPEQAGHDLWLTRNGHGAGFWDRGLGEVGQQLSDIARSMGGSDAYVGDDGKVHLT